MTPPNRVIEDPRATGSEADSPPSEPEFLSLGRVARPHGVRGELLLEIPVGRPPSLAGIVNLYFGPQNDPRRLTGFRLHRKQLLVKIDGVEDRDTAETFRGQQVCVATADAEPLQPGEYYVQQLIGMSVLSEDDEPLGTLVEVIFTGANEVYVVRDGDAELLLPAIKDVIRDVDVAASEMRVRLIPGLCEP